MSRWLGRFVQLLPASVERNIQKETKASMVSEK